MNRYNVLSNIQIKGSHYLDSPHYKKSYIDGYSFDVDAIKEITKKAQKEFKEIKLSKDSILKVKSAVSLGKPSSIYDAKLNITITVIPLTDKITKENIGFLTVRSYAQNFISSQNHILIIMILIILFLAVLFYSVYKISIDKIELKAQKDRFQLAIDGADNGLFDWEVTTDTVYYSPRWKSMIGYKDDELENEFKEWKNRVHPDDIRLTMKLIGEYLAGKSEIYDATFRMKHKEGHWVWINARGKASEDEKGNLVRMVGFHTDVTEIMQYRESLEAKVSQQLEKLRENDIMILEQSKMASLGEMIGNIAHQWRQPISTISMGANNLITDCELDELTSENVKKEAKVIGEQTQYLSKTIDDFRNFIKEEKIIQEVVLQDQIDKTISIIHATLENNFIELRNKINYEEPKYIKLCANELSQVLLNIFNNAKDVLVEKDIKHPWIEINFTEEKDKLVITIEDNGGGIAGDVIHLIFDPYFTTKHKNQGTGLGLYISYKIVTESLKGKLYTKNTDNGAKFFIELPLKV
jgi:PAS domain S-box-containing protein